MANNLPGLPANTLPAYRQLKESFMGVERWFQPNRYLGRGSNNMCILYGQLDDNGVKIRNVVVKTEPYSRKEKEILLSMGEQVGAGDDLGRELQALKVRPRYSSMIFTHVLTNV